MSVQGNSIQVWLLKKWIKFCFHEISQVMDQYSGGLAKVSRGLGSVCHMPMPVPPPRAWTTDVIDRVIWLQPTDAWRGGRHLCNVSNKELSAALSSVRVCSLRIHLHFCLLEHLAAKSYHVDLPWLTTATARRAVSFITFPKTAAVLSTALN